MQGVTTAIVAFIFVCVVYPHLIKNKAQFYAAMAMILCVILLDALGLMFDGADDAKIHGFRVFAYAVGALLQVGAILLLLLGAGGQSLSELRSEVSGAIEVVRRGGEKEVIVPLRGERPRGARYGGSAAAGADTDEPIRHDIVGQGDPSLVAPRPSPRAPAPPPAKDSSAIPLE